MTPEEIENLREDLQRQRYDIGFRVPMPTPEAIAAHNAEIGRLEAALAMLPPPRPIEPGGTVEITHKRLGSTLQRQRDELNYRAPFPTAEGVAAYNLERARLDEELAQERVGAGSVNAPQQ